MPEDERLFKDLYKELEKTWGKTQLISEWLDFSHTDYYTKEMGSGLKRRLILFKEPADQENLKNFKVKSWEIEEKYSINNKRQINIDPGFLTMERFILLTGKNYSHRIYLGEGVFADLTFVHENGEFTTLSWTYSDYKFKEIISFLERSRNYLSFVNSNPLIMKERQNDK